MNKSGWASSDSADGPLAWPSRRPWMTLAITLVCVALSARRFGGVRLNSSLETMLNRGDPSTQALARVMTDFASVDDLLVMASLPADASDGADAGLDKLRSFVHRFDAAVKQSPQAGQLCRRVTLGVDPQWEQFVERELAPAGLYYLSDDEFAALCRRLSQKEIENQIAQNEAMIAAPGPAGALAKALLKDPLRLREFLMGHLSALRPPLRTYPGVNELISADGRHALILIRGRQGPNDLEFSKRLTQVVRALADQANRDGLQLAYGGSYAIAAFSAESIRWDMILNIASSLLAIQLLFWLAYRGLWSFLLTMGPTVLGIVAGFGLFAFFTPAFNPLTAAIGGILAGLGIDYPIYFLAHYRRQRAQSSDAPTAAERTTRLVGLAVFSACATSIAGFSSIGLSNVPGLRDFAILGALGLVGALLASVTVLPAVLRVLEIGGSGRIPGGQPRFDSAPILRAIQRRRLALIGTLTVVFIAALVVLAIGLWRNTWFESDINVMHPQPNPALEAQRQISTAFGFPPTTLLVYMRESTPSDLATLAYEADRRLRHSDAVRGGAGWCVGPATFLPDPAITARRGAAIRAFNIERAVADLHAALEASVFDPATADDYTRLLRRLFSTAPPPDLAALARYPALSDRFLPKSLFPGEDPGGAGATVAGSAPTEAVMLVNLRDPLADRQMRTTAIASLRAALAGLPGATLTGMDVVAADTELAVRRDLWKFLGLSSAIIILWVLAHFRRVAPALLALLPVSFGLAVMLAYMAVTGDRFNMVNLLSVPLLAGCGVDYGLFLVTLNLAARRHQAPTRHILAELQATCYAVLLANLASVLGFGGLITSSTPALRSLGRLAGLGMLACLAGTLLFLLPLLLGGDESNPKSEARNPNQIPMTQ